MTAKTEDEWAKFQLTVTTRESCSKTCEYYKKCPLVIKAKKEGFTTCQAKALSPEDRRRFMNFFIFEEEGLRDEIMQASFSLSKLIDYQDVRSVTNYLNVLVKIHKTLYYMEDKNKEKPPESLDVKVSSVVLPKKRDDPIIITLDDGSSLVNDPESIINSPIIDQIAQLTRDKEAEKQKKNKIMPENLALS